MAETVRLPSPQSVLSVPSVGSEVPSFSVPRPAPTLPGGQIRLSDLVQAIEQTDQMRGFVRGSAGRVRGQQLDTDVSPLLEPPDPLAAKVLAGLPVDAALAQMQAETIAGRIVNPTEQERSVIADVTGTAAYSTLAGLETLGDVFSPLGSMVAHAWKLSARLDKDYAKAWQVLDQDRPGFEKALAFLGHFGAALGKNLGMILWAVPKGLWEWGDAVLSGTEESVLMPSQALKDVGLGISIPFPYLTGTAEATIDFVFSIDPFFGLGKAPLATSKVLRTAARFKVKGLADDVVETVAKRGFSARWAEKEAEAAARLTDGFADDFAKMGDDLSEAMARLGAETGEEVQDEGISIAELLWVFGPRRTRQIVEEADPAAWGGFMDALSEVYKKPGQAARKIDATAFVRFAGKAIAPDWLTFSAKQLAVAHVVNALDKMPGISTLLDFSGRFMSKFSRLSVYRRALRRLAPFIDPVTIDNFEEAWHIAWSRASSLTKELSDSFAEIAVDGVRFVDLPVETQRKIAFYGQPGFTDYELSVTEKRFRDELDKYFKRVVDESAKLGLQIPERKDFGFPRILSELRDAAMRGTFEVQPGVKGKIKMHTLRRRRYSGELTEEIFELDPREAVAQYLAFLRSDIRSAHFVEQLKIRTDIRGVPLYKNLLRVLEPEIRETARFAYLALQGLPNLFGESAATFARVFGQAVGDLQRTVYEALAESPELIPEARTIEIAERLAETNESVARALLVVKEKRAAFERVVELMQRYSEEMAKRLEVPDDVIRRAKDHLAAFRRALDDYDPIASDEQLRNLREALSNITSGPAEKMKPYVDLAVNEWEAAVARGDVQWDGPLGKFYEEVRQATHLAKNDLASYMADLKYAQVAKVTRLSEEAAELRKAQKRAQRKIARLSGELEKLLSAAVPESAVKSLTGVPRADRFVKAVEELFSTASAFAQLTREFAQAIGGGRYVNFAEGLGWEKVGTYLSNTGIGRRVLREAPEGPVVADNYAQAINSLAQEIEDLAQAVKGELSVEAAESLKQRLEQVSGIAADAISALAEALGTSPSATPGFEWARVLEAFHLGSKRAAAAVAGEGFDEQATRFYLARRLFLESSPMMTEQGALSVFKAVDDLVAGKVPGLPLPPIDPDVKPVREAIAKYYDELRKASERIEDQEKNFRGRLSKEIADLQRNNAAVLLHLAEELGVFNREGRSQSIAIRIDSSLFKDMRDAYKVLLRATDPKRSSLYPPAKIPAGLEEELSREGVGRRAWILTPFPYTAKNVDKLRQAIAKWAASPGSPITRGDVDKFYRYFEIVPSTLPPAFPRSKSFRNELIEAIDSLVEESIGGLRLTSADRMNLAKQLLEKGEGFVRGYRLTFADITGDDDVVDVYTFLNREGMHVDVMQIDPSLIDVALRRQMAKRMSGVADLDTADDELEEALLERAVADLEAKADAAGSAALRAALAAMGLYDAHDMPFGRIQQLLAVLSVADPKRYRQIALEAIYRAIPAQVPISPSATAAAKLRRITETNLGKTFLRSLDFLYMRRPEVALYKAAMARKAAAVKAKEEIVKRGVSEGLTSSGAKAKFAATKAANFQMGPDPLSSGTMVFRIDSDVPLDTGLPLSRAGVYVIQLLERARKLGQEWELADEVVARNLDQLTPADLAAVFYYEAKYFAKSFEQPIWRPARRRWTDAQLKKAHEVYKRAVKAGKPVDPEIAEMAAEWSKRNLGLESGAPQPLETDFDFIRTSKDVAREELAKRASAAYRRAIEGVTSGKTPAPPWLEQLIQRQFNLLAPEVLAFGPDPRMTLFYMPPPLVSTAAPWIAMTLGLVKRLPEEFPMAAQLNRVVLERLGESIRAAGLADMFSAEGPGRELVVRLSVRPLGLGPASGPPVAQRAITARTKTRMRRPQFPIFPFTAEEMEGLREGVARWLARVSKSAQEAPGIKEALEEYTEVSRHAAAYAKAAVARRERVLANIERLTRRLTGGAVKEEAIEVAAEQILRDQPARVAALSDLLEQGTWHGYFDKDFLELLQRNMPSRFSPSAAIRAGQRPARTSTLELAAGLARVRARLQDQLDDAFQSARVVVRRDPQAEIPVEARIEGALSVKVGEYEVLLNPADLERIISLRAQLGYVDHELKAQLRAVLRNTFDLLTDIAKGPIDEDAARKPLQEPLEAVAKALGVTEVEAGLRSYRLWDMGATSATSVASYLNSLRWAISTLDHTGRSTDQILTVLQRVATGLRDYVTASFRSTALALQAVESAGGDKAARLTAANKVLSYLGETLSLIDRIAGLLGGVDQIFDTAVPGTRVLTAFGFQTTGDVIERLRDPINLRRYISAILSGEAERYAKLAKMLESWPATAQDLAKRAQDVAEAAAALQAVPGGSLRDKVANVAKNAPKLRHRLERLRPVAAEKATVLRGMISDATTRAEYLNAYAQTFEQLAQAFSDERLFAQWDPVLRRAQAHFEELRARRLSDAEILRDIDRQRAATARQMLKEAMPEVYERAATLLRQMAKVNREAASLPPDVVKAIADAIEGLPERVLGAGLFAREATQRVATKRFEELTTIGREREASFSLLEWEGARIRPGADVSRALMSDIGLPSDETYRQLLVPKDIAIAFSEMLRVPPSKENPIVKLIRLWKAGVVGYWPGRYVRDFISNMFHLLSSPIYLSRPHLLVRDVVSVMRGEIDPDALLAAVDVGLLTRRAELGGFRKLRLWDTPYSSVGNVELINDELVSPGLLDKLAKPAGALTNTNEMIARLALFQRMRRDGYTAEEALMEVKRVLFDYADLLPAERALRAYVIPFYAWFRKNTAYHLYLLSHYPFAYTKLADLWTEISYKELSEEERRMIGREGLERMPFFFRGRSFFIDLPPSDFLRTIGRPVLGAIGALPGAPKEPAGVARPLRETAGSVLGGPLVQLAENVLNYSLYTGKPQNPERRAALWKDIFIPGYPRLRSIQQADRDTSLLRILGLPSERLETIASREAYRRRDLAREVAAGNPRYVPSSRQRRYPLPGSGIPEFTGGPSMAALGVRRIRNTGDENLSAADVVGFTR